MQNSNSFDLLNLYLLAIAVIVNVIIYSDIRDAALISAINSFNLGSKGNVFLYNYILLGLIFLFGFSLIIYHTWARKPFAPHSFSALLIYSIGIILYSFAAVSSAANIFNNTSNILVFILLLVVSLIGFARSALLLLSLSKPAEIKISSQKLYLVTIAIIFSGFVALFLHLAWYSGLILSVEISNIFLLLVSIYGPRGW